MSVVISVNVGLPRDVEWQGKTVRTAIWKRPVEGRVMARRLNLAGDGQADLRGHGGEQRAIMVYQLDSYRYWERYLGRSDFVYGQFGENLTVDGLADTEVCIGDRFRIGGAVFEITQPRVTCYRVGIRTNYPEMPALLVSHHRPGFYFRVLEEGEIGAGDEIVKIADGPEQMTVAEIDSLLYTPDHPTAALQRALRIPALSPGWQGSFKALLTAGLEGKQTGNAALSSSSAAPLLWRGFRPLKVAASSQESEDVRSFVLTAEDGSRLPDPLAGQHIVIKLRPKPDSPPLTRNYSLSGPPDAGTYRIGVKREPGGIASAYLHEGIHVGDILEASAPRGSFTLASGTGPLVLLSAGIGVTPLLAMLHASVAADAISPREVWWIHGARDGTHHSFSNEARRLIQSLKLPRSSILYSRPSARDRLGQDYDAEGHLDLSLLQRLGVPKDCDFYLCGPGGFLEDMSSGLKLWGVAESRVHAEVFGPSASSTPGVVSTDRQPPHLPTGTPGTGPLVTFARSGLAVRWNTRFQNLLELAEACDVPASWSCRTGICHNCECALIEGELSYSPDPLDMPADGYALICCSVPLSDVQLDL
jgi:ferredoxin-NADP reductase/MOSC domain-containing protein YiiM